jgi:NAD+-dependent protein deacetylase sirtuin 4
VRHDILALEGRCPHVRQQHIELDLIILISFLLSCLARWSKRARSFVGFPITRLTIPNAGHRALTALHNDAPCFLSHIAQNVDGLFQKAGILDEGFVELHGTIHLVQCLDCREIENRDNLQVRMEHCNREWARSIVNAEYRADGDAELEEALVSEFHVPLCKQCGKNTVMPKFVFMGDSVPKEIVATARQMVDNCSTVLVCGSTVTTYSAYSLVTRAKEAGCTVAIVNYGETRADHLADLKIQASLSDVMRRVARELLQQDNFAASVNPEHSDWR